MGAFRINKYTKCLRSIELNLKRMIDFDKTSLSSSDIFFYVFHFTIHFIILFFIDFIISFNIVIFTSTIA